MCWTGKNHLEGLPKVVRHAAYTGNRLKRERDWGSCVELRRRQRYHGIKPASLLVVRRVTVQYIDRVYNNTHLLVVR